VWGCNTPPIIQNVGQNGTNICLKLKVKVGKIWSKFEIKDGQSYEIVRNFNNFYALVMFALKQLQVKHFYYLVQILGKVGKTDDDNPPPPPPPPNVDVFTTSLFPNPNRKIVNLLLQGPKISFKFP
jgi:hypothetical protein